MNKIDGDDGHMYRLKKIDEIPEILIAERDKRNKLSTKYNRGVNIIGVIDNCLGVSAFGLGITGVGLLSAIFAAPVVIGIEAVSIVMCLLRVVGNRAIKKLSQKIEKHEKIAILAVSALNTISCLISKEWSNYFIPDEEYSLILLEFETFTRMKEDLRIKSKTSFEKTVNIETEANELLRGNKICVPTWVRVHNHVRNHVQNHVQNSVQNHARTHVQNYVRTIKNIANKKLSFLNITDPKKRDFTVNVFLKTRQHIQQNCLSERVGDLRTQYELSNLFKPVTDMHKDLKEDLVSELQPIREEMKNLPKAITFAQFPSITAYDDDGEEEVDVFIGDIAEQYLQNFPSVSDNTFWLRDKDGTFYIGNKEAKIKENNIIVGDREYVGTYGLWKLIVATTLDDKMFPNGDFDNYAETEIMHSRNAVRRNNDESETKPEANKSW